LAQVRGSAEEALSAFLLWLLTFLFSLRVAGQAVQRWAPQPWLPPFDAFQGSNLPYWFLLLVQLVILGAMVFCNIRRPRGGKVLLWVGVLYMAGSLARIAVGVLVPDAHPWFRAWISGAFHIVLAAYLLVLARFPRRILFSN
jgi:hypothetical protein